MLLLLNIHTMTLLTFLFFQVILFCLGRAAKTDDQERRTTVALAGQHKRLVFGELSLTQQ